MTTTPVPSMERVKAVYELRKDSARPDHREIASFLAHYLALRAALDVEALKAGAALLNKDADKASDFGCDQYVRDQRSNAAALRHLIQIQEGA